MRFVAFDLETTGFDYTGGHKIVEIGAVEIIDGKVTGNNFHSYVNPERDVPMGAYKVHGLSEKFLSDKPLFTDYYVARSFIKFVGDSVLIAHNGIKFDLPFMNYQLKEVNYPIINNNIIDTLLLARMKYPGAPASLNDLYSKFRIDKGDRDNSGHGALIDSKLLADVFINMTGGVQNQLNIKTSMKEKAKADDEEEGAKQREIPLPDRLTQEELDLHRSFVTSLEGKTLWEGVEGFNND